MKQLSIFLFVILLSGCVPHTEPTPMPEFAKKFTTSSTLNDSYKNQSEYIKCMENYGKENATSNKSASEIAVEATAICHNYLLYYETGLELHYTLASIDRGENSEYSDEKNKHKLQNDVDQLIAEGKRATISQVVQLRAKNPSNNVNN